MLASDVQTALEAATGFTLTTVRVIGGVFVPEAANPANQAAVDAALPGVLQALQDAEVAHTANQSALADMIATFTVSAAAIQYFNVLQTELRDVSLNNSVDIAAVFPVMRDLLDNNPALYQRYLNLLRITTGISQATFENTPTVAQQRNAFAVCVDFANTGMIQMIAGVMFG